MPEVMKECPSCKSPYGYAVLEDIYNCPECSFEWNIKVEESKPGVTGDQSLEIKDANGNLLQDGDSVVVIKDLPVKGFPKPIKAGTKVKNIRLTEGEHNIDCKIKNFGAMTLKSEFVKKG